MKSIFSSIALFFKEIGKFVVYYPCTFISKHVDYFHYKLLSSVNYPIFTINPASAIIGNKCYGNLWAVKNATGEDFHPDCMIEHGVYFGEFVMEDECKLDSIDTIYTYSEYRKNAILKWFDGEINKKIIPIGPYILYADNFKSQSELKDLKTSLGRVLLVFPSHSLSDHEQLTNYDVDAFMKEVDEMAKGFDSVLVSVYWADVKRGYDKPYIKRGYKVVCSGIRSDRWFLSRQKDLFTLADFSMSNDLGTHIGYSVAMGVPHYIFKQKVEIEGFGIEYASDIHNQIRAREYNEIIDIFSSKAPVITERQKEVVAYYWGIIQ